jgi:hypothetical protein
MRIARSLFLALGLVAVSATTTHAAWGSSSVAGWFGLGNDKSKVVAKTTNVPGTSGTLKTPRVVTKMADGTKRLASSTTSMLSPKKITTRKSGTTSIERAKDTKEEKPGFFKSLFHSEPPPPPKTIKEWMSLKQIHP